ncbi:MAG: YraN family protein [Spirochaetaceae bacterium]|jgi:putative endonuclease|nr:YraN family protein [Spirochaetaceae bacterium]
MGTTTFSKGRHGEDAAARELERRGITVITRNFRSPHGEIDIVATEGETLIFVEVKSWGVYSIDNLELSINKKKRVRIIETAKFFLQKHRKYSGMAIRFDIIFIGQCAVTHIESAWTENV